MTCIVRVHSTLEFRQKAVRLVRGGQSLSSVARGHGVSAQSIDNWVISAPRTSRKMQGVQKAQLAREKWNAAH